MAPQMSVLADDLMAEGEAVLSMVASLAPADFDRPTPAEGWAIRDQLSHLAYFDGTQRLAATDPERFMAEASQLIAQGENFPDFVAARYREMNTAELVGWFTSERTQLVTTFAGMDSRARLPWYGPPMSAASAVSARIMETWAHGQDIADALSITRTPTDRLYHIAHIGVATFGFTHQLHGLPIPGDAVRVELLAPSGVTWTFGPEGAANLVKGDALSFCLVVTQRRHLSDTGLHVTGPVAHQWMSIAQAYAGAPGKGRAPGISAQQRGSRP
ncbi:MAG: TIGR03084 family metal-binding protein [Acidimicrobiales bacterium]